MRRGILVCGRVNACGGRYRLKAIVHLVDMAWWLNLRSLPPNDAISAFVSIAILLNVHCDCGLRSPRGSALELEFGNFATEVRGYVKLQITPRRPDALCIKEK